MKSFTRRWNKDSADSCKQVSERLTHGLRRVIIAYKKGGKISIPGVYGGITDEFPIGAVTEKGLSLKNSQSHLQKYMPQLLKMITDGKLDTTFLISHHEFGRGAGAFVGALFSKVQLALPPLS